MKIRYEGTENTNRPLSWKINLEIGFLELTLNGENFLEENENVNYSERNRSNSTGFSEASKSAILRPKNTRRILSIPGRPEKRIRPGAFTHEEARPAAENFNPRFPF